MCVYNCFHIIYTSQMACMSVNIHVSSLSITHFWNGKNVIVNKGWYNLYILSTHITPEVVPETQCGFRGNRSRVDMIFCLQQLQEKKSALSRTDHCTWYLSTSVRRSIQLGGPGYGSY